MIAQRHHVVTQRVHQRYDRLAARLIADIIVAERIAGVEQENLVLAFALADFTHFSGQVLEAANHAGMIELRGAATWITGLRGGVPRRSEEHTSELQSLMRISYAVFCLKKK